MSPTDSPKCPSMRWQESSLMKWKVISTTFWPITFATIANNVGISSIYIIILPLFFTLISTGKNILCNSMCPGFVKTDMTNNMGKKTPDEAAETAVWLATLPGAQISVLQQLQFCEDILDLNSNILIMAITILTSEQMMDPLENSSETRRNFLGEKNRTVESICSLVKYKRKKQKRVSCFSARLSLWHVCVSVWQVETFCDFMSDTVGNELGEENRTEDNRFQAKETRYNNVTATYRDRCKNLKSSQKFLKINVIPIC